MENEQKPKVIMSFPEAKQGRPTIYNKELAELVLFEIATTTDSLRVICQKIGIGITTLMTWLRDKQDFQVLYARAKEMRMELMEEELLEIVDEKIEEGDMAGVQDKKVRTDVRKWIMSKRYSRVYGDKIQQEHTHKVEKRLDDDQFAQLIDTLKQKKKIENNDIQDAEIVE